MEKMNGALNVQITSADPEGLIRLLLDRGITLAHTVIEEDLQITCHIQRSNFREIVSICEKRGDTVDVTEKSGIFWFFQSLIFRPVLVVGLSLLLLFANWISARVFFVQVDGNVTIPDRKIIEAAEDAGIYFGAARRNLRSEQVKNILLETLPELKWACVNTHGCVATISVRERTEPEKKERGRQLGSIVADRDGVITSCNAIKGTLLCAAGKAVKKGEILISGYTDCGIYIQASQAEGEVFAQTIRQLEAIMPAASQKKEGMQASATCYSLILGKKRINLWKDSGISDTLCDRMYAEYYMVLPGGFQLPVALTVDRRIYRETVPAIMEAGEAVLSSFGESYLRSQMVAGSIQDRNVEITKDDSAYRLTGTYFCTEMIGRRQREQIGE